MSGKLDQYAMETYEVISCVRGHHVGEQLVCKREVSNTQDTYAVAVIHGGTVVGHVPRKISAACSLFLGRKGSIRCTISGCSHACAHAHTCTSRAARQLDTIGEFKIWL